jgi:hypothetical protein
MSVSLEVRVRCPGCGTVNRRREILAAVADDCVVAPVQIMWCRTCGGEIGRDTEVVA